MAYLYLAIAIVAEVAATSMLKETRQFTRPLPSVGVIVGYALAFYCMSLVLRSIPVGVTYAVWAGLGIVLVALVGIVVHKEHPDLPALLGIGMIVCGVLVIHLFSKTVPH